MLTIFSIPKPFHGHNGIIQRNAIKSWINIEPKCEIILFGDDDGVEEICKEFGLKHIKEIKKSELGTPYLDEVFFIAQEQAKFDNICYVNCDIILFDDILEPLKIVKDNFLVVGKRRNADIVDEISFSELTKQELVEGSELGSRTAVDYFIFKRGEIKEIPGFIVGRPGWDNWMIYNGRSSGMHVVDGSSAITAIHQNHDYKHVPKQRGDTWEGPEGDANRKAMGGFDKAYFIDDCNFEYIEGEIVKIKFKILNLKKITIRSIINLKRVLKDLILK